MIEKEMVDKDKFPMGLRVLVIDDSPVCLKLIETILIRCHYKVTKETKATNALKILRENTNSFDIVLTDVQHEDDIDGFKLLEIIGLEMDIPVIMISGDNSPRTVRKGVEYGACDFIVKPVQLKEIQNIWQHVVRRSKSSKNDLNVGNEEVDQNSKQKKRNSNQIMDNETNSDERFPAPKKTRIKWSEPLQKKFVAAYDKLGPDNAIPSKILLELRDIPELTREQVASHLQKYRGYLQKTASQERKSTVASSGMSGQLTKASISSFDKQGQNSVNCFNSTRAKAYGGSQVQVGHYNQNRDALSHSFVSLKSHLLHLNQQDILARQYSRNIVGENRQRMQVRELSDIASNSIMMGSLHHQTYMNGLNSQSFSSRSRFCNAYMEMPSKVPDYNASTESRSSNFQLLGCTSNSLPIQCSLDFARYPIFDDAISNKLNTAVQNDIGITTLQDFLPGQNDVRDTVLTNMESSKMEHSISDQIPSLDHPLETLETDSIYQLSSCSSTDDDLTAAIKQFQQQSSPEALIESSHTT